jgi:hypothetical protein
MADNLVYEESLNTESETSEFISKKWVYVNDNNSQNYTSQVVIDSTPLSNAGGYISWQESFIVMPLVVQLTAAVAADLSSNTNTANYAWAFKSGFWNMINSMTVEFNNQNIIQQTPFLNVFRSFKANTSFSQDDLLNEGSSIGFYPDSPAGWSYDVDFNTTATYTNSTGQNIPFTNNQDAGVPVIVQGSGVATQGNFAYSSTPAAGVPSFPAATSMVYSGSQIQNGLGFNEGMFTRQGWYNNNSSQTTANPPVTSNTTGQATLNPLSATQTVLRSSLVSSVAGSATWNVYAKLRLKDLADFFEKAPLLKGSTIRFYINTNQSIISFSTTKATITAATGVATIPVLKPTGVSTVGGLTCPIMLASAGLGQGLSPVAQAASTANATNYQLSVSIVQNTNQSQSASADGATTYVLGKTSLTSCRLYAPVYYMSPLAESKYLSLAPTKKIMYKDVFQYQFNNVAQGSFNFLVSNGISSICSVLVVPFISQTNNYVAAGAADTVTRLPFNSQQNPCSGSPASPDPIILTNFNILISGVNLFLNNELYDFEAFRCQLLQSNQINGSLTTGLASGLISEASFTNLYRYYYGDASRVLPSEQGVSRSVQIVGSNASTANCDLMVFVEFMREITIDISTGARIE